MTRTRRLTMTAIAIGVAAILTACTGGADEGDGAQDPTSAAGAEAGGDEVEGSAKAAGLDPENLPDPVHTVDVPATVDGDPDATMTVDFYGLTRDEKTVIAQFGFTVNSDADVDKDLWTYLGGVGWSPHLIDTTNLTKHNVLANIPERAQSAHQSVKFEPGETYYAFAVFAAPPNDVKTVAVNAVDGAPLIRDVVIQ